LFYYYGDYSTILPFKRERRDRERVGTESGGNKQTYLLYFLKEERRERE
jgi:hypothetical protein